MHLPQRIVMKNSVEDEPIFSSNSLDHGGAVEDEPVFALPLDSLKGDITGEPVLGLERPVKTYPDAGRVVSWTTVFVVCALSGLLSVATTFISTIFYGGSASGLSVILFAPTIEEFAKVLPILIVLDKNPNLFRSTFQIIICAVVSGLSFAAIENVLYLNVYIRDPSVELVKWRWSVCVALHSTCCFVTSMGFAKAWRKFKLQPFTGWVKDVRFFLFSAIFIHCLYNFLVMVVNPVS